MQVRSSSPRPAGHARTAPAEALAPALLKGNAPYLGVFVLQSDVRVCSAVADSATRAVISLDMADSSGEQESDAMRGIQHMQIYKHRLNKKGGPAARRGYKAPDKPDVMMVVGNELVLDSRQVSTRAQASRTLRMRICLPASQAHGLRALNCTCPRM